LNITNIGGSRQLFEANGRMVYLDNAATTFPKPSSVIREVTRCLSEYGGNPGRSSHRLALKAAEAVYSCRCAVCEEFGGEVQNVVFTQNATHALNLALKSFAKKAASDCERPHILISSIEHNSLRRPAAALAKQVCDLSVFDVKAEVCHPKVILSEIESAMTENTRIIAVTHASNICGITLPIHEIGEFCRRRGLYFIVDASQSAGLYDINIDNDCIDALCCPGHKSLYGIQGSGFVLFSSRCALPDFWGDITAAEGGSGSASFETDMPRELPERFEAGTLSTPAIASLNAGLRFIRGSKAELRARESAVIRRIRYMLLNTPHVFVYAPQFDESSILLFNIEGMTSNEVSSELDRHGICTRSGFHCAPTAHELLGTGEYGAVRISCGAFNTPADAELLYRYVKRMAAGYKGNSQQSGMM